MNVKWALSKVDDGYKMTAPAGNYPNGASPYGLLDMAGNVYEWTADWYDEKYYATSPAQNPKGPTSGTARTIRGGSWYSSVRDVRVTYRYRQPPELAVIDLGFRCARDP
jgi:formylglycine-generating enzyme required for sulfatase activity